MTELRDDPRGDIARVGLLAETTRRLLYRHVVEADGAVSREEVSRATGVPVHTAKFHLDKMVAGGLLGTEFHKLTGRTGPGSGRPTKHYRRHDAEIAVSLPPRHYDLLSRVLADAVARAADSGTPVGQLVGSAAQETGREVGRGHAGDVESALESCGYQPSMKGDAVILRNCPFRRAATRHPELICGINLDFVAGLLEGSGAGQCEALPAPACGGCCVRVAAR